MPIGNIWPPNLGAGFWLTILGNLLPLVGVLFSGWDIYTLLVFYWCETLIIAFWVILTIVLHKGEETLGVSGATRRSARFSWASAAMILVQTGLFMALHLFLMSGLYGDAWPAHLRSIPAFIDTFVIGRGLWQMLGLLFVQRAAIFWQERLEPSVLPAVAGLYLRIFTMQVVIVFGAWGVMLFNSGIWGLILLVAMKMVLEFFWPSLIDYAVRVMRRPRDLTAPAPIRLLFQRILVAGGALAGAALSLLVAPQVMRLAIPLGEYGILLAGFVTIVVGGRLGFWLAARAIGFRSRSLRRQ